MNTPRSELELSKSRGGQVEGGVKGVAAALGLKGSASQKETPQPKPLNLGLYGGNGTYNMPCDQIPPGDPDGLAGRIEREEQFRADCQRITENHQAWARARNEQLFAQSAVGKLPASIAERMESPITSPEGVEA